MFVTQYQGENCSAGIKIKRCSFFLPSIFSAQFMRMTRTKSVSMLMVESIISSGGLRSIDLLLILDNLANCLSSEVGAMRLNHFRGRGSQAGFHFRGKCPKVMGRDYA